MAWKPNLQRLWFHLEKCWEFPFLVEICGSCLHVCYVFNLDPISPVPSCVTMFFPFFLKEDQITSYIWTITLYCTNNIIYIKNRHCHKKCSNNVNFLINAQSWTFLLEWKNNYFLVCPQFHSTRTSTIIQYTYIC